MKNTVTYRQFEKNLIRKNSLSYAVEVLTTKRSSSTCVNRNYVRKLYNYFTLNEDDSNNKRAAFEIIPEHIINWERLHDSCIGNKRPEDLSVCYLSGPEPDNDFSELVSLGVLPQNIWAFESDRNTYKTAISSFHDGTICQPHMIKQKIENFFELTPKKFDIVYIDACGAVASSKKALKTISSLCQNQRLNSPGVIITNFSEPDKKNYFEYTELISEYLFLKKYPNENDFSSSMYVEFKKSVQSNIANYYSDFVSCVLRDIPSVIVPIQRISNNHYFNQLAEIKKIERTKIDPELIQSIKNNSLCKYFFIQKYRYDTNNISHRTRAFINELGCFDNIIQGLLISYFLNNNRITLNQDISNIANFFESGKLFQFLDKPHKNMFFDVIINQLTYPLHYNTSQTKRYMYKAKNNNMFTDISVYDECRYIYEWVPSIHQIKTAFENNSFQYIFRFALDGLVKSRQELNNEFFYQGTVVPNNIEGFEQQNLPKRIFY